MHEFYIRKNSVNPVLRVEVIYDGRYDYKKSMFNYSLLDADVTFSMRNIETGLLKVSKAKAEVVEATDDGCEDRYVMQYKWNPRDVKEEGTFEGWFEVKFHGDLTEADTDFLKGNFILPVQEELIIYIK